MTNKISIFTEFECPVHGLVTNFRIQIKPGLGNGLADSDVRDYVSKNKDVTKLNVTHTVTVDGSADLCNHVCKVDGSRLLPL